MFSFFGGSLWTALDISILLQNHDVNGMIWRFFYDFFRVPQPGRRLPTMLKFCAIMISTNFQWKMMS